MMCYDMCMNTTVKITDAEFAAQHPRAGWQRGYCTTVLSEQRKRAGVRPALYSAFRNRETGEVHYLHGRALRTAAPVLARRFKSMAY